MKMIIPRAFDELTSFARDTVEGLHRFGDDLGVVHSTEEIVKAILDETVKNDGEYQAAKTIRSAKIVALTAANEEIATFLSVTRDLLKPKFGSRYSQAWNEVGFRNNSLALPGTADSRRGLATSFGVFLTAHPELQVPGLATPAIITELCDAAVLAQGDVNAASTTVRSAKEARDESMDGLKDRLRKLHRELREFLPANDPRWLEFGFNVPGDSSVPQAPEDLVITPGIPGRMSASWTSPVGADRFRVFRKVLGQDEKFKAAASTTETAIELSDLTSGAHVQFYVTAINAAGESVPSEVVEVVVP